MGNPTIVYFYREDVMMKQIVNLETTDSRVSFRLPIFVDACVAQAQYYVEHELYRNAQDILSKAEYQIVGRYSAQEHDHARLDPLDKFGAKKIMRFSRTSVFRDIEHMEYVVKDDPLSPPLLYAMLKSWRWGTENPRIPNTNASPFRLLLKKIVRPGMNFFEKKEVDQIVKVAETMLDELIWRNEWEELIEAHTSSEYALALFYSLC